MENKLSEIFKWLHRHPELALKEYKTTEYLRKALLDAGIRLLDTKTGTGIIAVIGSGKPPVIALRADIDALPIQEETGLPYASETPGIMHACGHDFHAACMLGAAMLLKEREAVLPGTVKVIFQPAEEIDKGSKMMTETGLLDDVRLFLAGHTYPWLPVGTIGIRQGSVMASADRFSLCIKGKGCHAADPDMGTDPIPALGAVISAFQTIVSRRLDPFDGAVVSITRVQSGNTWNVIPETALIEGTVRAMKETVRSNIRQSLEQLAVNTAKAYGCTATFEYENGPDVLFNNAGVCETAKAIAGEVGLKVEENPPSMIAEDFSRYLKLAPGALFRIGTGGGYDNHHPLFTADPAALLPAARFFAKLAEKELYYLTSK
ncbi:MAG: amidohydrolase [Oscillospiraceae bacterium]|nr:amidohydrolase [Oscillospiraceae bacterium]